MSLSFSEKVGAYYQSASNSLHTFAASAKASFAKAATYINETATKIWKAVEPHFQRFKETTVTFVTENKMSIGLVAIGLGIGTAITALIACLFKGKSQEAPKPSTFEGTPLTPVVEPKKGPTAEDLRKAGGVPVLPQGPVVSVKTNPSVPKIETPAPLPTPVPLTKEGSVSKIVHPKKDPTAPKTATLSAPAPVRKDPSPKTASVVTTVKV